MNSEFQSLPPETQEAVKRTMDTMEPAQTPEEIRETLEGTQKGGVKNSIRNCLTVFQRDPLFRGALRHTTIYNTALYLRLSRDDELQGESGSIQTQRMMLRQYAAEHGLTVVDEYIDDGWSGMKFRASNA